MYFYFIYTSKSKCLIFKHPDTRDGRFVVGNDLKIHSPAVTGFRQISDFSVLFDGESVRISKEMPGDGLFTVREHPGVE